MDQKTGSVDIEELNRWPGVRRRFTGRRKPKCGRRGLWPGIVVLLLCLLLSSIAVAAPAAKGKKNKVKSRPAPLVVVAEIAEKDVVPAREYVGHVEAIQKVDLRARVEGFLEEVRFHDGDFVKAGQLLYVIEQTNYQARVAEAEAGVEQARAELVRAERHLKRLRAAGPESVRATDIDSAEAAELAARASLAAAEAGLTLARLDLDYTRITAPISGRIGRTAYTRGNLVNLASGPLNRIVQVDPIWVVYSVSENDVAAIMTALHDSGKRSRSRQLRPQLRLGNGALLPETGRVVFVDNQVDPRTGTITVRAQFKNHSGRLIPGQYVTVLVKSASARVLPVVPQSAVLVSKQGRYVLAVNEKGQAVTRPIEIGPQVGPFWAVTKGLQKGDKIIVQGIQKVRPGQVVRVKELSGGGK